MRQKGFTPIIIVFIIILLVILAYTAYIKGVFNSVLTRQTHTNNPILEAEPSNSPIPTVTNLPVATPDKNTEITNGTICQKDKDCENGYFCMATNCIKTCNKNTDCKNNQQCKIIEYFAEDGSTILSKSGCQ